MLALGLSDQPKQQSLTGLSGEEASAIDALRSSISEGSELLAASGLTAALFAQTITMLEIGGQIRSLGLNSWALA